MSPGRGTLRRLFRQFCRSHNAAFVLLLFMIVLGRLQLYDSLQLTKVEITEHNKAFKIYAGGYVSITFIVYLGKPVNNLVTQSSDDLR